MEGLKFFQDVFKEDPSSLYTFLELDLYHFPYDPDSLPPLLIQDADVVHRDMMTQTPALFRHGRVLLLIQSDVTLTPVSKERLFCLIYIFPPSWGIL
jgi:hypothetical protein